MNTQLATTSEVQYEGKDIQHRTTIGRCSSGAHDWGIVTSKTVRETEVVIMGCPECNCICWDYAKKERSA